MIQFWFLWFFIAIVVVLVAFTLRKERDDMPRKDILRAVETNASGMGLAEKTFLWAFSWLDTRFRIQDYWGMSKNAYHSMHRQMPLTHAEKYKLRIIWYWYPLYCLGGISFLYSLYWSLQVQYLVCIMSLEEKEIQPLHTHQWNLL